MSNSPQHKRTQNFLHSATKQHNGKYNYDLVNYINSATKVTIICPIHGNFDQRPNDHRRGDGCPACKFDKIISTKRKTTEQFIKEANQCHFNFYNYSKSVYQNAFKKVEIICPKHGSFLQSPGIHITGCGCPICAHNCSRGERHISNYLKTKSINYEFNKTFPDLISPRTNHRYRFDFWLPDYKTIIEYDGLQHFKPVNIKGRINDIQLQRVNYKRIIESDKIKTNYAKQNGYTLIRINYSMNTFNLIARELDRLLALEISP